MRNLALCCLALTSAGCDDPTEGDRARINRCPTNETCSARHPKGLRFVPDRGPDDGVVALGGTRTLRIASTDEDEPLGRWSLDHGSDIFDVERLGDVTLRITARAEGRETIRILDPETGELLDRKEITIEAVSEFRYGRSGAASSGKLRLAGDDHALAIELVSKAGHLVVDDSLSAEWNGDPIEASWWSTGSGFPSFGPDRFGTTVNVRSPAPVPEATATLTINAAGQTISLEVLPRTAGGASTEQIEAVVRTMSVFQRSDRGRLKAGAVGVQCWSALSDSALISGAEFAFDASANVAFEQVGPCVRLSTPNGGVGDEAWVQVRSGALTRVFPIDIE